MKKILSILLAALVAAGMTACRTEGEPSSETEQQPSSQQTAAEDPQPSESGPQSRYLVVYFSYAENAELPEDADVEASASIQRWNGTLTGNTGVGKSSLLNRIDSRLALATGETSQKLGRGRHTTRHVELYRIGEDGYIADTPGFSSFETEQMDLVLAEDLQYAFPEFEPYIGQCRFTGCAHVKEKGCAVLAAVENGEIAKTRHESYVKLYESVKDLKEWELTKGGTR